jgi:hypothetical protein
VSVRKTSKKGKQKQARHLVALPVQLFSGLRSRGWPSFGRFRRLVLVDPWSIHRGCVSLWWQSAAEAASVCCKADLRRLKAGRRRPTLQGVAATLVAAHFP